MTVAHPITSVAAAGVNHSRHSLDGGFDGTPRVVPRPGSELI
jgi:hypothetical protein